MRGRFLYDVYLTTDFKKNLRRFDGSDKKRIAKSIEKLSSNPYHNTPHLKGNLQGRRKYRAGNLRIVFAICEECQKLEHNKINNCIDCDDLPENGLKMFDVGLRGAIYS